MKVSIFGLGYVGAVSCACLAREGHKIIGIDVSEHKVSLVNSGKSPIVEKDLENLIADGVTKGDISATTDSHHAVLNSDISIVCVGTPSLPNGNIDLGYIFTTIEQIGSSLKKKGSFHVVTIRSTVAPGTISNCIEILERTSGKKVNVDFGLASNPEFLREGTAIRDFFDPPYTIIGPTDERTGNLLAELYSSINAPIHKLRPEEAELVKYANNSFHAVKITFANEIGNICKELGVDGHAVMNVVAADKKLNLSSYYMKPGFAYGGSCLPKDVRAITYRSRALDLQSPLLESLNISNSYQVQRGLSLIEATKKNKIGFLGFAFKADTDDLRESPVVILIETLLGKGYTLSLFDENVAMSKLVGKNKSFIMSSIPHVGQLMNESAEDVISKSDVIVIGNSAKSFKRHVENLPKDKTIIDLVRVDPSLTSNNNYVGICW